MCYVIQFAMSFVARVVELSALLTTIHGSDSPDVASLSELSLDRLLHVKRALMDGEHSNVIPPTLSTSVSFLYS